MICFPGPMRTIDYGAPVNRQSPLNRGLVAWWIALPSGGKGNTRRDICSTYHGDIVGPTWGGNNGIAQELTFDGVDDYVSIPAAVETPLTASAEATLIVWIKLRTATPAAIGKTGFVRFTNSPATSTSSHYPYHADGKAYISTLRTNRSGGITLSTAVIRTEWHQVAITSKAGASGWVMYQNTTAVLTASTGSSALDEGNGIWLGRSDNPSAAGAPYFLDGWIASTRLYNRALKADEVTLLYHEGVRGYPTTISRLKRYWIGGGGAAAVATVESRILHSAMAGSSVGPGSSFVHAGAGRAATY